MTLLSTDENKKSLTERDVCTKCITPALVAAGWDLQSQLREEMAFTAGRVALRDELAKALESTT